MIIIYYLSSSFSPSPLYHKILWGKDFIFYWCTPKHLEQYLAHRKESSINSYSTTIYCWITELINGLIWDYLHLTLRKLHLKKAERIFPGLKKAKINCPRSHNIKSFLKFYSQIVWSKTFGILIKLTNLIGWERAPSRYLT